MEDILDNFENENKSTQKNFDLEKIALDRIAREVELKKDVASKDYIRGYVTGINDIVWDCLGHYMQSLEYYDYLKEKGIKIINTPLDKIKPSHKKDG